MNNKNVVVIGASMIDIIGMSNDTLLMHDSNPGKLLLRPGGVGHNIACNLSRLDGDVTLLTTLSNDPLAKLVRESLFKANVNHIEYTVNDSTMSSYMAVLDEPGELVVSISDTNTLDKMPISFLQQHKEIINRARLVVLDASLSSDHFAYLKNHHQHVKFYVDPVSVGKAKHLKNHLELCHVLKCNVREAEYLADMALKNEDDYNLVTKHLHHLGVKRVIITRGEQGGFYSDRDNQFFYDAIKCDVVNVTGAGDSFMAGFIAGELAQRSPWESIRWGSLCASATVMTLDTVNVHLNRNVLYGHHE